MRRVSNPPRLQTGAVWKTRAGERGAAIFVVVLVITLLSALGLFAVKGSSLSNKASGYNRQLMQTHYVTDLGVVTTATDLSTSLHETYYLLKNKVPDLTSDPSAAVCEGHSYKQNPQCVLLSFEDLDQLVTTSSTNPLLAPNAVGAHGSLGPVSLEPDIRVEITDAYDMAPPGGYQLAGGSEDTQGQQFAMITVSVTGLVMPPPDAGAPATDRFDLNSASAAGIERQRARIRMGPVLAQK